MWYLVLLKYYAVTLTSSVILVFIFSELVQCLFRMWITCATVRSLSKNEALHGFETMTEVPFMSENVLKGESTKSLLWWICNGFNVSNGCRMHCLIMTIVPHSSGQYWVLTGRCARIHCTRYVWLRSAVMLNRNDINQLINWTRSVTRQEMRGRLIYE